MNKNWFSPGNIQELTTCLSRADEETRVLAGGTDLLIELRNKGSEFSFIDLSTCGFLKEIRDLGEEIWLGSMVTHAQIKENSLLNQHFPGLSQSAGGIGSQQIRNRGTIGGNIANASPAADMMPILYALQARVEIVAGNGDKRQIAIADFHKGSLSCNECILGFIIPVLPNSRSAFVKLGSRSQVTIAKLNGAICWQVEAGQLLMARMWLGAIQPRPISLAAAMVVLLDQKLDFEERKTEVISIYSRYIEEVNKNRPSSKYKKHAVRAVLTDLLSQIDF